MLAGLLCGAAPGQAQQPWEPRDPYTVTPIEVDQRALDELAAKQEATLTGQRQALETLIERITLAADRDKLPEINAGVVRTTIRDYTVDEEKYGGGRYIAKLTVRFHKKAVRDWLQGANIPFSETVSRPVLVLPVYQAAGATFLWDASNPWLAAWRDLPQGDRLMPLLVPEGNFSDISIINARQALRGEDASLAAIARKYRAKQVLVIQARHRRGLRKRPDTISASVLHYAPVTKIAMPTRKIPADSELGPALYEIADALATHLSDDWKQRTLIALNKESNILLRIPLNSLSSWVSLRAQLESLPPVVALTVDSLSTSEAQVRLRHAGELAALKQAMIQLGITITVDADTGAYILHDPLRKKQEKKQQNRPKKAQS